MYKEVHTTSFWGRGAGNSVYSYEETGQWKENAEVKLREILAVVVKIFISSLMYSLTQ